MNPTDFSPAELWDLFGPSILAALTTAALCGYLGVFVVLRRVAFVSAALGQVSGLTVALGFLLGALLGHDPHEATPLYLDPVLLALVATAAVAGALTLVGRMRRTPPEALVAFVYLVAAALALVVLASPAIVQEAHEVGDLLFGNSVAVRREHLLELFAVAAVVLVSHAVLFPHLVLVSFDPEMAQSLGLPSRRLELFLHLSIGVTVAVATRAVGALPVFGFLVLPAGAAFLLTERLWKVVLVSALCAPLAAALGFYLSFIESWPTGPLMVLCAAGLWPVAGLATLGRRLRTA